MQEQNLKKTFQEIWHEGKNVILFFVIFVAILLFVGSKVDLTIFKEYIENVGFWGPIFFILLKMSTIVISPLSGTPLYILSGAIFGIEKGVLYAFLGDLLGFTILFFVSRKFGLKVINYFTNQKDLKIIKLIQSYTSDIKSFIKVCLLFFWFPEASIFSVGLGKLSYFSTMIIFMPIYTIIMSVVIFVGAKVLN
ncbi:MAG TPA: hypothetical protein PJ997_00005 [Candidatus Paceibacterota bacterium]|nr:hypothetical protein [Candidatus Paceibacterota bacterium]HMP18713.1 hypothetical protein [Candidatus Paceibacterota bacterium]